MGACQSTQSSPTVIVDISNKPAIECSREAKDTTIDQNKVSMQSGMTRRITDNSEHGESETESLGPIKEATPKSSSTHIRKKSGTIVAEYLQQTGPASNRCCVHIESTLFGLPIEAVYDGVRDGHVLGEGVAGKVRLITHKETGIKRAVKRLDLGLIKDNEDEDTLLNTLLDEIKIMCQLDHPNVVCLEEVFEGESELFLTQELCEGGDLFDRLDQQPNYCYNEEGCALVMKQIILAVSYLHSKDIIHRDLKLENFLFMDGTDSTLKLIDFGLSKHFVKGELQHDQVGTPYSVAPEVILDKDTGDGYDMKCDVWSMGVLTYLLLSGFTPFGGDTGETPAEMIQVRERILSGEVSFDDPCWRDVSDDAIDFIKCMLVLDPASRPSSSELLNHTWMKTMKRNSSAALLDDSESSHLSPNVLNQLISFKEIGKTQAFLREIISFTLQPDQIAGLREEFEKIDVDGTGEISLHCFREALLDKSDQYQLSESEIEEIFVGLKVRNTDMCIRWHEFIAACLSQCHVDDRNIRLAFDRLDTERKGYITLKDLKKATSFYGSNSQSDLQRMWINTVMDYKREKENIYFEDFYELLKLDPSDDDNDTYPTMSSSLPNPTTPPRRSGKSRRGSTLNRSYVKANTQQALTSSLTKMDISPSRRATVGPANHIDVEKILEEQDSGLIKNVKRSRDIHDFILEASKRVDDKKQKKQKKVRRITLTGNGGLLMCNSTSLVRASSQGSSPTSLLRGNSQGSGTPSLLLDDSVNESSLLGSFRNIDTSFGSWQ